MGARVRTRRGLAAALLAVLAATAGATGGPVTPAGAAPTCTPGAPVAQGTGLGYLVVTVPPCADETGLTGYRVLAHRTGLPVAATVVEVPLGTPRTRISLPNGLVHRLRIAAVGEDGVGPEGPASAPLMAPFLTLDAFTERQHLDFTGLPSDATIRARWRTDLADGSLTAVDAIAEVQARPRWRQREAVARLYLAAFGRLPDRAGLVHWSSRAWAGTSLHRIAEGFVRSPELVQRYGDLDDEGFVDQLYLNTLGRPADPAGRDHWVGLLESGARTRGQVLAQISEASEHRARTERTIAVVSAYDGLLRRMPTAHEVAFWGRLGRTGVIAQVFGHDPGYHPRVVVQAPPVVATAALPDGVRDSEYRAAVLVEEGRWPVSLALVAGQLPPGLGLADGRVAGAPTQTGSWSFTLRATDGAGRTHDRALTIEVGGWLHDAVAVATGLRHACAALDDGSVRCWGDGGGTPGLGSAAPAFLAVEVPGVAGAVDVAAGPTRTCALLQGGTVSCWGTGWLGGPDHDEDQPPTTVPGLTGVTSLAAGAHHTCAVSGGQVLCWGQNGSGQLGDGSTTTRPTPVAATGITTAVEVAAAGAGTCARLTDGTVSCWGGSTPTGTTGTDSAVPLPVPGLAGATAIARGEWHGCALRAGGTVACWGRGTNGQLGDGAGADRWSAVDVTGLSGMESIGAGSRHTCAGDLTGATRCWGSNANGQLGDGTFDGRLAPVAAQAGHAVDVAGSERFTCTVVGQQLVRCWGQGHLGQLGGGEVLDARGPSTVGA